MSVKQPRTRKEHHAEAAGALLSLLAHDLREPLGPIGLALSMIAEGSPSDPAELADFAEAHCGRLLRLIDAVLWSMRPPGLVDVERADLVEVAADAAEIARLFGTACVIDATSCVVKLAMAPVRDAIAGLLDCVPDRTTAGLSIKPLGERATLSVQADGVRWNDALARDVPHDWQSAFVLGAAAVFAAHGGEMDAQEGVVTGWLPCSP